MTIAWTAEMDSALIALRAEGAGVVRCADRIGVGYQVCRKRIGELALPVRAKGPSVSDPAPDLLPEIERFLADTGMPVTKFGKLTARDPRFVLDLRKGRVPWAATASRVRAFIATQLEAA